MEVLGMTPPRSKIVLAFAVALTLASGFYQSAFGQKTGSSPGQQGGQSGAQGGSTPYFETQMLAYGGVNQISEVVAQRTCGTASSAPILVPANATIVIYDQTSFQNLGAWQSLVTGVQMLEQAYKTLLTPGQRQALEAQVPPANVTRGAAATSPSFIQGGADLGSLISAIAASATNNASTFAIQDSTLAVSLLHAFKRINCNVNLIYYPLFGAYTNLGAATLKVTTSLDELNQVRGIVQETIAANDVVTTSAQYSILADLNTQYDILLKNFISPSQSSSSGPSGQSPGATTGGGATQGGGAGASSQNTAPSGYASLVQGAELEDLIKRDDTYILYADVVAAGGTQRDLKNVWTCPQF
jgi:hypothetical protein